MRDDRKRMLEAIPGWSWDSLRPLRGLGLTTTELQNTYRKLKRVKKAAVVFAKFLKDTISSGVVSGVRAPKEITPKQFMASLIETVTLPKEDWFIIFYPFYLNLNLIKVKVFHLLSSGSA